jgi:hypothetical protein
MKKLISLVFIVFFTLSCGWSQNTISQQNTTTSPNVEKRDNKITPNSSQETITATLMPTPSRTPTRTPTQTVTPTLTETETPTLEPPAQTAQVKTETQIAVINEKTATSAEKSNRSTGTAQVRNQNRTATQKAKDVTATAVAAHKTMLARYKTVEPKKLITYPGDFEGEFVRFDIKIFNFIDEYTLQGWIIGGNYDPIIITFRDPYRDIYEDEIITVFGVVSGKETGINMFGGTINQVSVVDAWFRK